jgi:hypothetical protein
MDSWRESSVIAGGDEQLDTNDLKDQELAELQSCLKQRGSLSIWFDAEMTWEAKPSGYRGRQQANSYAAIQACLTIRVLFGLPWRQATGFVESLLELVGLNWVVPDFSTLCRRQRTLSVAVPYRGSARPLHLFVDSTGIKAEGEGEWNAPIARQANGTFADRGINEETLEIRAIEVTSSSIGDAPMLPDLLEQIPSNEEIGTVTADGAYDTRKCHDAIAARNAHAVIPPRKNAKLWKPDTTGARARNEAVRSSRYLGRALWRQLAGYHRRSRIETKMHCVKLLGQRLSARDFDRQVVEIQIRAAILNGFTALGIPETATVG